MEISQGHRPRELRWYHAGAMLFGDWGTSRLYVLGLCFFYARHASIWYMLAMSLLLLGIGWAYQVICRLYPDGGGVYTSGRLRHPLLGVLGGLLLFADYTVTAAASVFDAFHYLRLDSPHLWATGCLLLLGVVNLFGPRKSGNGALVVALSAVVITLVIALATLPRMPYLEVERPAGGPGQWWMHFTFIILAISGVETIANLTGVMVLPVEGTSRRAIYPVVLEIAIFNVIMCIAMQAVPLSILGDGNPEMAYTAHRDDMLRLLAEYYVGPFFAFAAAIVFALVLISAGNTALAGLVSLQYMMARDRELPHLFAGLNAYGMPVLPLLLAVLLPVTLILLFPDMAALADLYAIGVVGAVTINLLTTASNRQLTIRRGERLGLGGLGLLMGAIAITIAVEKPHALMFALSIILGGFTLRSLRRSPYFQTWWHRYGPIFLPSPPAPPGHLESGTPLHSAAGTAPRTPPRILVATRGNPGLLRFAVEEARNRQAELLVLFVRQLAVIPMGSVTTPNWTEDEEAQALFKEARTLAQPMGIVVRPLYAVTHDVAEAILELAVTYGVDLLILGVSQRGRLDRLMKGDVIQQVAQYLPERITLLIHA
ncbi:MAG: amino acid permease [Gemmataceae bacterium]|nr:amino acid permease [Gemmataceae bacterium]